MLEDQLERQESYRRFVYDDATGQNIVPGYTVQGNPTIGYGRNLMTEGISKEEATVLLRHDMDRAWREVASHLPWAESQLSVIRFSVLVNIAFNMGFQGLSGFTQMLSALHKREIMRKRRMPWWTAFGIGRPGPGRRPWSSKCAASVKVVVASPIF